LLGSAKQARWKTVFLDILTRRLSPCLHRLFPGKQTSGSFFLSCFYNARSGLKIGSMPAHDSSHKWSKIFDDMQEQRKKQQKIQRLMLDTSGRGQANFAKQQLELPPSPRVRYNLQLINALQYSAI